MEFWFGSGADDAAVAAERSRLWWKKHPDTDKLIRLRFEACLRKAASGELNAWLATAAGRLALILLADQFPRNMYRHTAQAFAFDALAQAWCKQGLELGCDAALRPIQRTFFYFPLEHSESLEDQERAVSLYQKLAASVEPQQRRAFQGFLNFAVRHRDVVARFGRFPHRNRILGRDSSPEEAAFLAQPGSSF